MDHYERVAAQVIQATSRWPAAVPRFVRIPQCSCFVASVRQHPQIPLPFACADDPVCCGRSRSDLLRLPLLCGVTCRTLETLAERPQRAGGTLRRSPMMEIPEDHHNENGP